MNLLLLKNGTGGDANDRDVMKGSLATLILSLIENMPLKR